MVMNNIKIDSEFIKLDSFLKWAGVASTGAEAKMFILDGEVLVNGEVEERRGRKLFRDDVITFDGEQYKVI